ncbi:hypothetical protein GGI35DRAFT_447521 [Trichoderma velutinum]
MPQSGSNKLPPLHLTRLFTHLLFLLSFFPLAPVESIHSLLASCAPQEGPLHVHPSIFFFFFFFLFQNLICSSAPDSTPPISPARRTCASN